MNERVRPSRIRVLPLNENHLPAVQEIEAACEAIVHSAGVAQSSPRALGEIVALTKQHNVRVAEADDKAIGYLAWRDESPGVAYLEELSVTPEKQRFGVASELLQAMRDEARKIGLPVIVTRAWTRVASAQAFLRKSGFLGIGDDSPERVLQWREEQTHLGKSLRDGEAIFWAPVDEA